MHHFLGADPCKTFNGALRREIQVKTLSPQVIEKFVFLRSDSIANTGLVLIFLILSILSDHPVDLERVCGKKVLT